MKKQSMARKLLVLMLAFVMFFPLSSMDASAAVGDLANVSTGLTGDINTSDTISMPVKILDYEADGMLFEYAESKEVKTDDDFGSKHYVVVDATSDIGNAWSDVTAATDSTNSYVTYTRLTWRGNTVASWTGGNAGIYVTPFGDSFAMDDMRYVVFVYRSNVSSDSFCFGINRNGGTAGDSGNYTGAISFTNKGDDGEGSATNWTYAVYDLKTGTLGDKWTNLTSAPSGIYMGLPIDGSGEWIDIAHIACFSDREMAEKFGKYALTDGSDRGDNRAFGLLRDSRTQSGGTAYAGIIDKTTTVEQLDSYGDTTSIDFSTIDTLGYTLLGTFKDNGIANVGLLESGLRPYTYTREITEVNEETGKNETRTVEITEYLPVYKKEVVTYLAGLLQHSLEIPERTSDGWKNYRYVKGTASDVYGGTDLASALRTRIKNNLGDYSTTTAKTKSVTITVDEIEGTKKTYDQSLLVGTWEECAQYITSYYDAAYFLLNSIFVEGSYNTPQDDYDYLVMSAGTDAETGDNIYVFDGGFTTSTDPGTAEMAIAYKSRQTEYEDESGNLVKGDGTIQNTSAAGKSHFVYEGSSTTTLNPFLPVTDRNNAAGQTQTPYYQDDGVLSTDKTKDTLVNRNYNFVMESSGEFVYYEDDELFFEFEGDDDVYLFVNGELLMDIGSAHSIDGVRFKINDYVNMARENVAAAKAAGETPSARDQALALDDGNVYTFSFFYMERHSYGSNIRINTNIHITDPQIVSEKVAWQDGESIDYGSIIDEEKIVEYGFSIENTGNENLYDLSYRDDDIGITLDVDNGLTVTGERVTDLDGDTLEATDLVIELTGPGYDPIIVTFNEIGDDKGNTELKQFLTNIQSDVALESRGGLWKGNKVLVRGIGYKLSDEQINEGVFDNTVFTGAKNYWRDHTLQGQATMRVFIPADPMYYQWAGKVLEVSKDKLIADVLAAAGQEDNILNGKVPNLSAGNVDKIEITTRTGNVTTGNQYVTLDSSYDMTISYPTAGSYVFYLKITYTYEGEESDVTVPVLANVTSVEDSVYVLDYGLTANLEDTIDLTKDKVTVPGRKTEYFLEGITGAAPSYSPNNITFAADADNVIACADGTYTLADKKLTYKPTDFMEGLDTVSAAVRVKEQDFTTANAIGTVDINNEVEMYKQVTVLPATVVYYEDNFPAITYPEVESIIEADGTATNLKNVVTKDAGKELQQSVDQKENYGHDNVYQVASNTSSSGGTLTTLTIYTGHTEGPSFKFNGTGFELICRTTAEAGATIYATVTDPAGNVVKRIPVITEFDNGADGGSEKIYQVPILRVDGLDRLEDGQQYTVTITGFVKHDYSGETPKAVPAYLYVDGLRIYQPLGETNENYTPEENGATFTEIRNLIADSKVAVAEYEEVSSEEDEMVTVAVSIGSGTQVNTQTWVENRNGDGITEIEDEPYYVENVVNSVDKYLLYGPNNEVYLEGTDSYEALVFYVKETDAEDAVHNLQVAMRAIDRGLFMGTAKEGSDDVGLEARIKYAVANEDGSIEWKTITDLYSTTEQYYTIDYTKCPYDAEKGYYQVIITVTDPDEDEVEYDNINSMVSFSTLKYNNLEVVGDLFNNEATVSYVGGLLKENVN